MIYVHIWKTHEFNPGIFHDIPCRLDYFTWSLRPTNSLRSLTDSSLRDEESATAIPRCFFVAAALAQKKRCCLSRLAGVCGQTSVDSFNPSVVTLQLDELLFAYLYQFFFCVYTTSQWSDVAVSEDFRLLFEPVSRDEAVQLIPTQWSIENGHRNSGFTQCFNGDLPNVFCMFTRDHFSLYS